MAYSSNEVKAGMVITISVLAMAFTTYYIGNFQNLFEEKQQVTVFFKSVNGLKRGDPILYAGIESGNIVNIVTTEVKTSAMKLDDFAKLGDAERFILSKPRLPAICVSAETGDLAEVNLPLAAIRRLLRKKSLKGLEGDRDFDMAIKGNGQVFVQRYKEALVDILPLGSMSEGEAIELLGAGGKAPETRTETRVAVTLSLPRRLSIHRNSQVRIDKSLTGNLAIVVSQGWGQLAGPDEVLVGDELTFIDRISTQLESITQKIDPLVSDVQKLVFDLRSMIAHVKDVTVEQKVDPALDKLNQGLADLQGMLQENRPGIKASVDSARETMDNLKAASADAKEITSSNKDRIAATLKNVEETSAKINKAGDGAQELMTKLTALAEKGNGIMDENRRNIQKTVENLKTLSVDATATVADIRRHPWRLLVKPDDEDVNTLNVYDAARDYNRGATAINDAVLDLLAYLETHPEGVAQESARLRELGEHLQGSLGKFDSAETHFWKTLADPSGSRASGEAGH